MMHCLHNRRNGTGRGQRGASLIEVLVALVILVIGILSVIRLFPGGFIAIRNAQDDNIADRLAQAQLEELRENSSDLLDAVFMYDPNGTIDPSFDQTTQAYLQNPYPNPQNANPAYGDINKARYISGETFTVPAPNNSAAFPVTQGICIHALNDGPIVLNGGQLAGPPPLAATPSPVVESPVEVYGLPRVHSGSWTAKLGAAPPLGTPSNPLVYQNPGNYDLPSDLVATGVQTYAIDYNNEEIAVAPQLYQQEFTLEIKLMIPGQVVTEFIPILLPAENSGANAYTGAWFSPTAYQNPTLPIVEDQNQNAPPTGWLEGSAVLTCTLTQESNGMSGLIADPNPYTYAISSSDAADSSLTLASLGVLGFNPRLTGKRVSVSYLVYDWHILHEDDNTPVSASTQLPLVIDHIQPVGAILKDQSVNLGIFRASDVMPSGGQYDLVLLDTDTGQSIGLNATVNSGADSVYNVDLANTAAASANQFQVSYENGYIILPTAAADPWSNASHQHLRVYYTGDFNWAVALEKAPSLLTPGSNGALLAGQYALSATGSTVHLHFPQSDMGETIEADDVNYTDSNGNPQQVSTVTGTVATDFSDSTPYIDLGSQLPNVNTADPITIGTVRGISVRSVVIWKERGQWKTQSLSTVINSQ